MEDKEAIDFLMQLLEKYPLAEKEREALGRPSEFWAGPNWPKAGSKAEKSAEK